MNALKQVNCLKNAREKNAERTPDSQKTRGGVLARPQDPGIAA